MKYNCLPAGVTLDQFKQFYIAPNRDDSSDPDLGTEVVQCEPGEAEFWSIYGVYQEGYSMAVHDERDEAELVRIARQINLDHPSKQWFYRDERFGPTRVCLDFIEIAEDLTEFIHDDLPDLDADDWARVDDFDEHPLAPLREAFVVYSDYAGLNTARDPSLPVEA